MNNALEKYQEELMKLLEEIYKDYISQAISEGLKRKKKLNESKHNRN